jgi:polysaccharide export outer membrane protein
MKKKRLPINIFYIFLAYIILIFSCSPVKNVVYFQNLANDTTIQILVNKNMELKIRKNDLLSISIISPEPVSTALFNGTQNASASSGATGASTPTTAGGHLVDNEGNIAIYKLGVMHVEGLTRSELKQKLQKDLAPYLVDAVINIRFLSNHVTMLGEVSKPQVINIPNEQISLLEAIAQSGDLTITGRRDNILIIRETERGKQFQRLNLSDKSIFASPFYYLKPDDVVYVEPIKLKIKSTTQTPQIVSYALSGVTILITVLALFLRR